MCMCLCIYINKYIGVCVCVCVIMYIHIYVYTELEIGGVASQNANHSWVNCESYWQSDTQYCESLLFDLQITFHEKDLFFGPH